MKPISRVRQAIGKGSSIHSGRGFYEMFINESVTQEEIVNRLKTALVKWRKSNLIKSVHEDNKVLRITFNEDQPYNIVQVPKANGFAVAQIIY